MHWAILPGTIYEQLKGRQYLGEGIEGLACFCDEKPPWCEFRKRKMVTEFSPLPLPPMKLNLMSYYSRTARSKTLQGFQSQEMLNTIQRDFLVAWDMFQLTDKKMETVYGAEAYNETLKPRREPGRWFKSVVRVP